MKPEEDNRMKRWSKQRKRQTNKCIAGVPGKYSCLAVVNAPAGLEGPWRIQKRFSLTCLLNFYCFYVFCWTLWKYSLGGPRHNSWKVIFCHLFCFASFANMTTPPTKYWHLWIDHVKLGFVISWSQVEHVSSAAVLLALYWAWLVQGNLESP